ncbi:restriction endonuclease subunit S [Chryseobacterium indologenes]|uniref:methylation-associated defense system restriction endonuclease subunit S MAD5 n=1 Tax=Chryseobacterium indologenes TaxID=253 RepID=UPI000F4F046B|nr:restriction endonuclease subunit S [Chryseobacterium indologenes]AYZ35190.1 restriction endonuclease subunit S [Chryseobacterium indologenes]MEB4761484.1 restriction endonuclease subunit S [Chryseobacterium indologenes]
MKIATVSNKNIVNGSKILKPNYHLNYGKKRIDKAIQNKRPFVELKHAVQDIYTGGIFRRLFVEREEFGLPYISAQHMMNSNPLEIAKIISKKHTPRQEDMTLRTNQILVSCAGTVGNVRLIDEDLDGIIGSQDIIRVISDNSKFPYGYIYAFLASPTAYNYIQSYIYGTVVPRIEPKTLANLPVPNLSKIQQQKIHDYIVEASKLRVEANRLLKQAINYIENQYNFRTAPKTFKVNISTIKNGDKYTNENRLEADYYLPNKIFIESQIRTKNNALLGDLCESVSISNLRARTFVNEGVTLFTGQSLGLLKPDLTKQLSRTLTSNIEQNLTKDGDVLVSAFGTLGKTEYCYKNFYTGVFASQQIVRIRVNKSKIDEGYLYVFLKSKVGQELIQKFKTGSVIEWANWNNFCSILVPIPDDLGNSIGNTARIVATKFDAAFKLESQAIALIEKEIDLWQVS